MTEQRVTLNGLNVRYSVEGVGPDVVFVHGWMASRRMWTYFTAHLSQAYRCWAFDLPGCGDSDKPSDGWYTIPNYTATVREFMRTVGLLPARLVGHSMGGLIALDLAAAHPQLVERLVAINPVVTGQASLRPLVRFGRGRSLIDLTLRLSPRVLQPVLSSPLGDGLPRMEQLRRRTEDFAKGTTDSILGSGHAVVAYDVSPRLARITAPTLVILGDQDRDVPNREGRLAAAQIPGARLSILRAGHHVTDDRPAETLHLLQEFLA